MAVIDSMFLLGEKCGPDGEISDKHAEALMVLWEASLRHGNSRRGGIHTGPRKGSLVHWLESLPDARSKTTAELVKLATPRFSASDPKNLARAIRRWRSKKK
jgi:hypothetical protein